MDDLAADVDGRAESLKSDLDDVDGADDSGAETTWFEQQHPLFAAGSVGGAVMGNGFDGSYGHISKYTNGRVKGTGEKSNRSRPPQQQPGPPISRFTNPAKQGLNCCICSLSLPN